MRRKLEMVEGPEAWKRFEGTVKSVLAIPHSEIQRRIEEHRREVENNPHRRGPKRKIKSSASPVLGV
jgi:hypothetical protein